MKPRTRVVIVTLVVIAAAISVFALYSYSSGPGPTIQQVCQSLGSSANGVAIANRNASTVKFAIIESDSGSYRGMNGSYYKSFSTTWPVMHVFKGQQVIIQIYNCASSEPHGFQIAHYYDQNYLSISPGQSFTLPPFTANEVGNFTVYCDIACSIHIYMQNGLLMVTT